MVSGKLVEGKRGPTAAVGDTAERWRFLEYT